MNNLSYTPFHQINLNDPFFDTLKQDYTEFPDWFIRKKNEYAYTFKNDLGMLEGFIYLKIEDEALNDVMPPLPPKRRMKIGTLKINAHGTRLGERFIKKAIDHAIFSNVDELYVTIFDKHAGLLRNLQRYGFNRVGTKTTANGAESVLVKSLGGIVGDVRKDYPFIDASQRKFLLALYPDWHTRLLPDSILSNENADALITDVSHTNSINKIYLTKMHGTENLRRGDILLIYRTTDKKGPAHYRSVATSLCVVDEVRDINDFSTCDDFLEYASSYSIFTEAELRKFYVQKNYHVVIRFTYNAALKKRVNRAFMIEELGMSASNYWGFFQLTNEQFDGIKEQGEVNESVIIN